MVPLPLFKLAALLVRHVSKYGANHIKAQAHEHPRFRQFAARYGQSIHQINMRLNVALLRNPSAEARAKEKAEAPTVKTKEEIEKEEEKKRKKEEQARIEAEQQQQQQQSQQGQQGTTGMFGVRQGHFRVQDEEASVPDITGQRSLLGLRLAAGRCLFVYLCTSRLFTA
ncbi:hypothetical protein BN1723_007779, partial [Verticillium longisporum]